MFIKDYKMINRQEISTCRARGIRIEVPVSSLAILGVDFPLVGGRSPKGTLLKGLRFGT